MLSDSNVRRINSEIANKLSKLDSFCTSTEEKEEIRKDLIVLRDLLDIRIEEQKAETSLVAEICEILRNSRR
jgi:restriction endonuclease S subunit